MLNEAWVVAGKETVDSLRDTRSLISAVFYALMGPAVVGLVWLSGRGDGVVMAGMMSVFTQVAAFVGGMNVALDTVAGERERRSLLPLLLNPVPRVSIVMGKWMAVSLFAVAGLVVDLAGFALLQAVAGVPLLRFQPVVGLSLLALAGFAAALQVLVSAVCRNVKEAHTYLSLLVFLPMGAGFSMVFFPSAAGLLHYLPVVGVSMGILAVLLVLAAGKRFERDDVLYGE